MSRATRWAITALTVIVAAAVIGLGGWVGYQYWVRADTAASNAARAELGRLAAEQVQEVFGYDYQTVERSLTDAYTLLTPDYRREFEDAPPRTSSRKPVSVK